MAVEREGEKASSMLCAAGHGRDASRAQVMMTKLAGRVNQKTNEKAKSQSNLRVHKETFHENGGHNERTYVLRMNFNPFSNEASYVEKV